MSTSAAEARSAYNRAYYIANREAIKKRSKVHYAKNRARHGELKKAHYVTNKDRYKDQGSAHYAANRDLTIARATAWNKAHPDAARGSMRIQNQRRRARLRSVHSERIDLALVWEREEGLCGICGLPADPKDWHLDHAIPLARGGEHTYANVQVSHPECNRKKGAR